MYIVRVYIYILYTTIYVYCIYVYCTTIYVYCIFVPGWRYLRVHCSQAQSSIYCFRKLLVPVLVPLKLWVAVVAVIALKTTTSSSTAATTTTTT